MSKVFKEKQGNKVFERSSRWNLLEYTIISDKSINAPYADNYGKGDKKLFLTYIKFMNTVIPLNKFKDLPEPILLEDFVTLTKYCEELGYYLEVKGERVKVYWESI